MWVPSLTLAGLAVRRLGHQWPLALAQLLGVTAAVTLAASIPLMQSAAVEAGVGQACHRLATRRRLATTPG